MAEKRVTVVIDGKEHVSDATKKADGALGGFSAKVPIWAKAAALAAGAYAAISAAIRGVKDIIVDSFRAWDEAAASQRKLESSGKLLGISQEYLNKIVKVGRDEFLLSRTSANEFAVSVATLEKKAGATGTAIDLLSSILNLGAAKGLDAAQSMQALQQSLLGIDEGTDKLFGKNPSGLFDDFAKVIGRAASKFDDTDKAAALAFATLQSGIVTSGTYQQYLESAAGQQEVMNTRMTEAKVTFAEALTPIRLTTMELAGNLLPVLGPLARVIGGALAAAVVTVAKVFNTLYGVTGNVIRDLGKLTGSKAMEEWGQRSAETANRLGAQLNEAGEAAGRAIRGVDNDVKKSAAEQKIVEDRRAEMVKQMADLVEAAKMREGRAATNATRDTERAHRDLIRSVKETYEMLNGLVVSHEDVLKRLSPSLKKAYDRTHIDAANEATKDIMRSTDDFVKKTFEGKEIGVGAYQELSAKVRLAGFSIADAARTTLDFAQSFGVLDRESASALNSIVNMGTAIGRLAGGDFTALPQFLGGLANVMSTLIGGDSARRQLLRENSQALTKLSRDIGAMKLNITGEDLAKAQTALSGLTFKPGIANFAGNFTALTNALAGQGLTIGDLERIAKEIGLSIRDKDGQIQFGAIEQVFSALSTTAIGRLGNNFQDQFRFFRDSQRIEGTTGAGAIGGVIDFLRNVGGVTALNGLDVSDPTALRDALRIIFTQLNNGEGVQGLGRLTGSQFMDIILGLIGDIDNLGNATGVPTSSGSVGGGDTVSGGGISVPTETVQAVVKAMDSNVSTILTAHTTLHERIAAATEGSYAELRTVNTKLDDLIAVTAGQIDATDAKLEALRRMASLERGVLPVLG
jgi:hypothetical protein